MRKLIIALFCLMSSSAFSLTPKTRINIQYWKTTKGTPVYFVSVRSLPMLDVRVIFAAGSVYDGNNPGLAFLTNSMIGEGTTTENANQIANSFDNLGAKFDTTTDRDQATVSLRSLSKSNYLDASLTEFTQVLSKMSFPLKTLERVKNQAIAAIKVKEEDPGSVGEVIFYKTIYGDQSYAHDPLGTPTSIKSIMPKDIEYFYKQYYVAQNASIVLVGDLTKTQAQKIAEQISVALPEGKEASYLHKAKSIQSAVQKHIPFAAKQSAIIIGQIGISRKNPNYFPLIVGDYAFGGLPLGSVLFHKVRNQKGLAYSVDSAFLPLRYRGPFIIQLKTRSNKTKEALSVVQNALYTFLKEGPTKEELDAAKQNLIGSFPFSIANNNDIASIVSRIAFYHWPLNYLDTYEHNIRAVTSTQIKAAFEKTIHPKHLTVITIGP